MSSPLDESLLHKLLEHSSSIHHIPVKLLEHQRHSTTGRVHCVLTRTAGSSHHLLRPTPTKYLFSIQMPVKHGDQSITPLILTAEKQSGHLYNIYSTASASSDGREINVGSIIRVQMNMYSITYVLKNAYDVSIAYIVYHVPSPIKVLRDPPSRFAEVALYQPALMPDGNSDCHDEKKIEALSGNPTSSLTSFDKLCLSSIKNHHSLSGVATNAVRDENSATMHVLQSIVPYVSKSTGRVTLNFHGRGKYASPKNMQLTEISSISSDPKETKKIYMQMCKWDNDTYHIDFEVPTITYLHAFAFGLAQADL